MTGLALILPVCSEVTGSIPNTLFPLNGSGIIKVAEAECRGRVPFWASRDMRDVSRRVASRRVASRRVVSRVMS